MARKEKQNIKEGVDRRETGYFSTPNFIAEFMSQELLRLNPDGHDVLDPCVGREELLLPFYRGGKMCVGYDLLQLKDEYRGEFYQKDFIRTFISNKEILTEHKYDYIVLNPPYNCHECDYIVKNKSVLKKHFNIGVYNMAALFLSAVIDIAQNGCLIGVIVPDAILTARAYEKLRKKILDDCTIIELVLCPDDLFHSQVANVSTCIMILKKGQDGNAHDKIMISDRAASSEIFSNLLKERALLEVKKTDIVFGSPESWRFVISKSSKILKLIESYPRLDSIYKCGGGISTGRDKEYTRKYSEGGFTVPFLTNPASARFAALPNKYLCNNFLERSKSEKGFIIRNREYLKKEGIAFSSIGKHFSAVYLPADTVTGVNAAAWPPAEDIYWLLAYMNSSFITYVAKAVFDRGNMTTIGCVRSLPVIAFDEAEKIILSEISQEVLSGGLSITDAIDKIDRIVFNSMNLDKDMGREVRRFCSDLTHNV